MFNSIEDVTVNKRLPGNADLVVNYNGDKTYDYNVGLHLNDVYGVLVKSALAMEDRVRISLQNYTEHPDVQANLQQLQYDLQSWNLALTTMTNVQKNMADALKSIVGNLR